MKRKNIIGLTSCILGGVVLVAAPCIGLAVGVSSSSSTQNNNNSSNSPLLSDDLYTKYKTLSTQETNVFANNSTVDDHYPTASEQDADHRWAFVGGIASGTLDDIGAARDYIGDFQEDIRGMWTIYLNENTTLNGVRSQNYINYIQRYVDDLAVPGMTLQDINQNWDRVTWSNPESVAYLISDEDFLKDYPVQQNNSQWQQQLQNDLTQFRNQLLLFVLNGLNLRNGNGYVFIQKHWATNNSDKNILIQDYNNQVDQVIDMINTINPDYLPRITVVNHYINTVNDQDFLKNDLNSDDQLNDHGQYDIGYQFADETYGKVQINGQPLNINWGATDPNYSSAGGYSYQVDWSRKLGDEVLSQNFNGSFYVNDILQNLKSTEDPNTIPQVSGLLTYDLPQVTSDNNATSPTLTVTLPSGVTETNFVYRLWLTSGYFIQGTAVATNNTFTIPNLQPNKPYYLKIFTEDGKQLPTVYGSTSSSTVTNLYNSTQTGLTLSTSQQQFQQKILGSSKLNWAIIGDSITHAAAWTRGWNGVDQDFQKTLQQDFGRTNDNFINLSVTGNTTTEELDNMKYRIDEDVPDIVIISLGLNDIKNGGGMTTTTFENNLTSIINQIRQLNPNCYFLVNNVIPASYITSTQSSPYNTATNSLCSSLSTSNSVVAYNDLYTSYANLLTNRAYYQTKANDYFYARECNHMAVEGSLFMALGWLRGLGFDVNDSRLNYMSYIDLTSSENNQKTTVSTLSGNRLSVDMHYVASANDVYDLYVKVEDNTTGQSFTTTTNTTNVSTNNSSLFDIFSASNDPLTIQAYGYSKVSPNKYVFLPEQENFSSSSSSSTTTSGS